MNIFLAGDSTVQTYDASSAPQAGWGQFIANYFTTEVQFLNRAIGGRSSKSFIAEGRLDSLLNELNENDYLFIQMGHNDATESKPERYTDPYSDFKHYLNMYVQVARNRKATPILITPVARMHDNGGIFVNDFPDYCNAMKQLASEEDVRLIDLMTMSLNYYTSIGYDETLTLFMASLNGTDFTHFTEKGADRIARLVTQGVKELQLDISKHVLLKDKAKVHLFLAGDSTVADYPASQAPMAGWGQMLGAFFSDEVVIQNEARCGKSSKSFILEGHFQRIVGKIGNGDYLFIQFGHNDEKPDGTEPFTTFQSFLSQYIDMARQKGATPVLVTPVHRRRFDEAGRLVNTHGEYPAAIRELSELRQVPLIDLCAATEGLYQSLGPEDSKQLFVWFTPGEHQNYTEGVEDNTHFSEYGAKEVARLVIERIADMGLPLTACM